MFALSRCIKLLILVLVLLSIASNTLVRADEDLDEVVDEVVDDVNEEAEAAARAAEEEQQHAREAAAAAEEAARREEQLAHERAAAAARKAEEEARAAAARATETVQSVTERVQEMISPTPSLKAKVADVVKKAQTTLSGSVDQLVAQTKKVVDRCKSMDQGDVKKVAAAVVGVWGVCVGVGYLTQQQQGVAATVASAVASKKK